MDNDPEIQILLEKLKELLIYFLCPLYTLKSNCDILFQLVILLCNSRARFTRSRDEPKEVAIKRNEKTGYDYLGGFIRQKLLGTVEQRKNIDRKMILQLVMTHLESLKSKQQMITCQFRTSSFSDYNVEEATKRADGRLVWTSQLRTIDNLLPIKTGKRTQINILLDLINFVSGANRHGQFQNGPMNRNICYTSNENCKRMTEAFRELRYIIRNDKRFNGDPLIGTKAVRGAILGIMIDFLRNNQNMQMRLPSNYYLSVTSQAMTIGPLNSAPNQFFSGAPMNSSPWLASFPSSSMMQHGQTVVCTCTSSTNS
uniref:Uncharacterized protein n=1 Tax=Caenorhabditis tropicalis TaxID=1561998 RepID=A0A1I7TL77_9PELO